MTIRTVAVIGASGNVGAPTVKALLSAGFKVTAVTRESSNSTFPNEVEVRKADLTSVESLTKAFAGQDAVVVAVATEAVGGQDVFTDAAIVAGVKRIIPSEFGHNTRPGKMSYPPLAALLAAKTKAVDYIIEKTKSHPELTWTGIATDPFFDWCLDLGIFGIDLKNKTMRILDSGNEPVSSSSLAFVAASVVAVLQHEKETANKYLNVAEFTVTQNEVLKIFEEETGAKFTVTHGKTADLEKLGQEKLARHDYSAFVEFLLAYNFHDGRGHAVKPEDTANDLLGLKRGNLREALREYIKAKTVLN
ncbi:isoflavone reductase [Apodospora peruviana]|uniref:Isoflavone reductase n=1 Tax=Apodospora peruviana TaxID=516989 RepID=A0AAE0HV24_9PEZI|nr:isoflavone reductase [Apodospora peruviana]